MKGLKTDMQFPFPKDFLWGAACSAYQIEAACRDGGKKPTVYDHFARLYPDRYKNALPDSAADFYHRYREDIALMKQYKLKAFRFSICWARIMTEVDGEINPEGIAYYNDVIDTLLENGITPLFDLFHCDLPMFVIEKGGPKNPDFVGWFTRYAKVCFENFGDRVKLWSTVNEPIINIFYSYAEGKYAPFENDLKGGLLASHNMLLAHYSVVKLYHSMGLGGKIGAVNYFYPTYPLTLDPDDVNAAEMALQKHSGWWFETMLKGTYPKIVTDLPFVNEKMPPNFAKELADAFEPMDFIGLNYYHPGLIKAGREGEYGEYGFERCANPDWAVDDFDFESYPQGLFDTLMYIKNNYGDPLIFVTENGTALAPRPTLEEDIDDQPRIKYMREHLRSISRAYQAGVNVQGYFCWSIMDTYEGNSTGYRVKFGLIRVDMDTLERTPRNSIKQYKTWIENNTVG